MTVSFATVLPFYAAAFARQKLQKSGRCHESEVFKQFRRANARYRSEEAISDDVLRDMVRVLMRWPLMRSIF